MLLLTGCSVKSVLDEYLAKIRLNFSYKCIFFSSLDLMHNDTFSTATLRGYLEMTRVTRFFLCKYGETVRFV